MAASHNGSPRGLAVEQLDQAALLHDFYRNYMKRPVDILFSAAALVACLPVLGLACLFIALESPGTPIFKQSRIGKNGKLFYIYKLRTMHDGADRHGFKTDKGDSRVTKLGCFLRDTKLDELPQLFNILCGEMSLIGPRPLSAEESDFVTKELGYGPNHPGFHPTVRPGCTGLEQIYRIHPLVYGERFEWNAHYESRVSFLEDLKILLGTMVMCRLVCIATICGAVVELAWLTETLLR